MVARVWLRASVANSRLRGCCKRCGGGGGGGGGRRSEEDLKWLVANTVAGRGMNQRELLAEKDSLLVRLSQVSTSLYSCTHVIKYPTYLLPFLNAP